MAKNNMKLNFENVLFTHECDVTLDVCDRLRRRWLWKDIPRPHQIRRQQRVGSVMFWDATVGNELVGPFRVSDGVKITSKQFIDILKEHVPLWYKKKSFAFRISGMIMHRLILQGLLPNTWPAFLPDMEISCNGQPALQI